MTIEFTEIYPKINVYHNAIKDPDKFLSKSLSKDSSWTDWGIYGRVLSLGGKTVESDTFPEWDLFQESISFATDKELAMEYAEAFYKNTKHYLELNPIYLDRWYHHSPAVCEYDVSKGHGDSFYMSYHSDFVVAEKDWPGIKFEVTTTTYLNDNYEDGELCFIIDGEDHRFSYKPKAGDMIVFPARPPYFHGVRRANGSNRYIIRSFWESNYPGSDSWWQGEKEHGAEEWMKIQAQLAHEYKMKHTPNPEIYSDSFSRDNERFGLK